MLKINSQCRDCGSKKLTKFLDFGNQPLANSLVRKKDLRNAELLYPLEVYLCMDCNLVQLIHVVDKHELFDDYVYFSAGMPEVSGHWQGYADEIMDNYLSDKNDLVFEIASNDGILLKCFKDFGFKILGIDPAQNIAPVAESIGVPTIVDYFSAKIAEDIFGRYGPAKAILANNVVAHINDHHDLLRGVKMLLSSDGVFVVEAPYLLDIFENLTYDTVYHEHLSYLAMRPMVEVFGKFGLEIFDAKIVPVQGRSIRLFAGHKSAHAVRPAVSELIGSELDHRMNELKSYEDLAKRVEQSRINLVRTLQELRRQGKRIASYGAPAKGNTLLNYCGIDSQMIEYARDDLPSKQGFFTPGTHIPIISSDKARVNPPDYYLLLAWNYKDAILQREKQFIEKGGRFIIPVGDEIQII